MSLKNTLTKLGLIEETIQAKPKTLPAQQPQPIGAVSAAVPVQTTPVVDPTILSMLQQSLQENKLSGFDYLKFVSAVDEMKAAGGTEDVRFKMAFFAAKQLGVDKDALVKSAQHYVDVLRQDESDFNADCSQFEKKEIQAREAKIAELEAKLSDLNRQLAQAQQDHIGLANELQDKRASLEVRKSSFQTTLNSLKSVIEANIQKINQYL